ncbi:hypothetical protein K8R66_00890 [bacterium]|nr:hypothetical protein [bacterium]
MKKIANILMVIVIIAGLFVWQFIWFKVPAQSVMKVNALLNDKVSFIENCSQESKHHFQLHKKTRLYETGKEFQMTNNFYAAKRSEKVLDNTFEFTVLFPEKTIAPQDTARIFNQIRAHAYIAMTQASNIIGDDFYGTEFEFRHYSYPMLFKHYLNEKASGSLPNLYFINVDISRVDYKNGKNELIIKIQELFLKCKMFSNTSKVITISNNNEQMNNLCNKFYYDLYD